MRRGIQQPSVLTLREYEINVSIEEGHEMTHSRDAQQRPASMESVLERIRTNYPKMTPSYRALASYVLEHHQELAFASATQVARTAGASPASVVRFADHLGLSGYTQLQALARDSLRRQVNTVSQLRRTSRDRDPHSVLRTALQADIGNLEQSLRRISDKTFARAVDILAKARTIHLIGLRSTFGLVRHFEFYLGWIGRYANVLQPGIGDLPEQIMRVSSQDACVGFSFRRYTRDTVDIFTAAGNAGAITIAITDSELSPLAERAKLTLAIPVQFPAFFESRVAVLSVMNALVFGIALATRRDTLRNLQQHEDAWLKYDTYVNEDFRTRLDADVAAFANWESNWPSHASAVPDPDAKTVRQAKRSRRN
jgi:DNA-binding MurR/RpiR family transcriptional regulator